LQKAYANLGYRVGDFPVTEKLAGQFLSLPIYPELQSPQVAEVVSQLEASAIVEAA
jgi:dTDP-4-amino-4,6-dideoxygalactose transaminase